MMRRKFLLLPLVLAACTGGLDVTRSPVTATMTRGVDPDRLIGSQTMTVRAYRGKGDAKVEVGGIPCTLRAAEFRADVVTPQQVVGPAFLQGARFPARGQPGPVTVTCKDGATSTAAVFASHPVNVPASPSTTVGTPGQPGYGNVYRGVLASNAGAQPWIWGPVLAIDLK